LSIPLLIYLLFSITCVYSLSLHDALPICQDGAFAGQLDHVGLVDEGVADDVVVRQVRHLLGGGCEGPDVVPGVGVECLDQDLQRDRKSTRRTPVTFRSRMPSSA